MDLNKLYKEYEYLANIYAKKLFSFERIGYEREDIVQDLKLKILTSLRTYKLKWKEFERTGRYKPIPVLYYLRTALINRVKDLMTQISKENLVFVEEFKTDVGFADDFTLIDFKKQKIIVREVDFLAGLFGNEKPAFLLYLKGYPINYIQKLFKKEKINLIVKKQVNHLKSFEKELNSERRKFTVINYSAVD